MAEYLNISVVIISYMN